MKKVIDAQRHFVLNNGLTMPKVGLGTFMLKDKKAIAGAMINHGYRHLDTAYAYQTETIIGEAIQEAKEHGIKREDLFIATKLDPSQFADPEAAVKESLSKLKLDYVDLYLIH